MKDQAKGHWRDAAETFIEKWQVLECVEGAIVTGSQVIGTATPESDVDIHIVLSAETSWRERGNKRVDGHLIEYFANPTWRYPLYLEEGLETGDRDILTQISTGEILFDKRGEVRKVVEWAEKQRDEFPLPAMSRERLEIIKYHLWDGMDGLEALYNEDSPLFDASCGQMLGEILKAYAAYLQTDIPAFTKIYKFFTDPKIAQAYRMEQFPDTTFVGMFISALRGEKSERRVLIRQLADYVLEQMGGFNIDGWSFRSPAR